MSYHILPLTKLNGEHWDKGFVVGDVMYYIHFAILKRLWTLLTVNLG